LDEYNKTICEKILKNNNPKEIKLLG